MNYISTRGLNQAADFSKALLGGLAPDGGLYLPEQWPDMGAELTDLAHGDYAVLTQSLLNRFGVGVLGQKAVEEASARTKAAFLRNGQTPLTQLSDNLWLLELFHGPTLAFKDMAMQMMAPLTQAALEQNDQTLTLVTATSGDTGAAAVHAFAGSKRVKLIVFHPLGRVSRVQRLQMTTVEADNILNIGIEGDFDDCQHIVKALLGETSLKQNGLISSVNSINWGRLLGQVPYYLAASAGIGDVLPEFIIPTGNFGDAFAGWVARKIGGSVGDLHAAVNTNDALAQAINHGHYARRSATPCASVSMDVQAPSNFERMIFEATNRDADLTRDVFTSFAQDAEIHLSPTLQNSLQSHITASTITEQETLTTIKLAYDTYGQIICPHTAVALSAALKRRDNDHPRAQIVLATAHPAKFPESVSKALGFAPPVPDTISALEGMTEKLTPLGNNITEVTKIVSDFIRP